MISGTAREKQSSLHCPESDLLKALPHDAKVLVDTTTFIYAVESRQPFTALFEALFELAEAGSKTICLSVITLAEVFTGPYQARLMPLAKRYKKVWSGYEVVPVNPTSALLAV